MGRALRGIGSIAVATAGCYLAYLASALGVWISSSLLLGALGKVSLYGFRANWALPWVMTGFPREGSAALYALHQGGAVVFGAAFMALALIGAWRARGWLRLWSIYVALWSSVLYALLLNGLAGPGAGGVGAALRVLWPARAAAMAPHLRVLGIGVGLAAAYFAARRLAGGSRWARLHWVLPLVIVGLFLSRFFRPGWPWTALLYSPALLALLFGLHGAGEPLRLGGRGAAVIVAAFGLACGGIYNYQDLDRFFRRADFVSRQSSYWRLHFEKGALPEARQTELAAACDQRLAALAVRLGIPPPNPALHAFFYASTERKIAAVGSDATYTVDGRSVHLLVTNSDPRGHALALLNRVWGKPASEPVARAIARYAAGDFHGAPLAAYAARITREEGPYPLAEVLEQSAAYLSPLVRDALGGAWVEMQVARRGTEILPSLYRSTASGTELETEWNTWQLENERRFQPVAPRLRTLLTFHRGVTLSHEYGAAFGYGSDRAIRQLRRLRELGANTVAVVPYAGTLGRGEPRLQVLGGETDDRVIRTIRAAHELGLAVTLKPQIWSGV
ncbi:MAG: hypothetical protein HY238_02545, partial [Acidobacteria bacterium]|nr:hypothetical protein [Acidobacteriota bacterium]